MFLIKIYYLFTFQSFSDPKRENPQYRQIVEFYASKGDAADACSNQIREEQRKEKKGKEQK